MYRIITLLFFICSFITIQSQEPSDFCSQLQALDALVKKDHFKPKVVDDSLSVGVHKLFLSRLDGDKKFFTQSDIEAFKKDRLHLDDFILNQDCEFIDKYSRVLLERIHQAKQTIQDLAGIKLDYSGKDTLYFAPEIVYKYFEDDSKINSFWSKRLRYNIIYELIEKDSILEHISSDFKAKEQEIKPKIIQKELCKLDELLNKNGGISQFVKESFLNAFLAYHDPNSSFFNDTDKTTYVNSLSNDGLSFGIITNKNDDGDIVIAHITPGSPAFINGNFETNDIIKSLQANDVILETYCVSNEDIVAFTNDKDNKTIAFKIKKQNGSVRTIELTKTKTKIEDNTVTGYLLKDNVNVGYISISSFYSDFESPNGLGVANDVAKELYKLQKENIDALILDLRFNGGGSMKEAADLSGMFINRGPLAILKYGNGESYTINDLNRGSVFLKPIVILINGFSASASEFFAAAMQDYNRAIIVGSPTHGKASAQAILPLKEGSDLGFSKLTVEKFYRVTGQSHQSVGVQPDIRLPDLYDNFKTQEQYSAYALQNDSIEVMQEHFKLSPLPIDMLSQKNQQRVKNNSAFEAITALNQLIINNYFETDAKYPLTLQNVYQYKNDYSNTWKLYSNQLDNISSSVTVSNTKSTNEVLSYNEDQKAINTAVINDISSDIYIIEAHHILKDLINIKSAN